MKDWVNIDFSKVKELVDQYDALLRLANEFQMFDSENVQFALDAIREEIRVEVEGKPKV